MIDETRLPHRTSFEYIETKAYRRFVEFAHSCTEYRYIGLCYGEPGVGKSLAAEYYCKWRDSMMNEDLASPISSEMIAMIRACKGVLYVAPVTNTPKIINQALLRRMDGFAIATSKARGDTELFHLADEMEKGCPLMLIDEADRLTYHSLEQLRNLYDEYQFGLILIGMPGMEKRLSRYLQLYSRIGFNHEFKKLSPDEMRFILERKLTELNLAFDANRFTDVEAINTIIRITAGNYRLMERLFSQINRILKVNRLEAISKEVVDAARVCLLIGSTN